MISIHLLAFMTANVLAIETKYRARIGDIVDFSSPCLTDVGSFSKSDEKGTIWSNGIVAKDKRDRFAYANSAVYLYPVLPSDTGEYVWVCDENYRETAIVLTVAVDTAVDESVSVDVLFKRRDYNGVWIMVGAFVVAALLVICIAFIVTVCRKCRSKEAPYGRSGDENFKVKNERVEYTLVSKSANTPPPKSKLAKSLANELQPTESGKEASEKCNALGYDVV